MNIFLKLGTCFLTLFIFALDVAKVSNQTIEQQENLTNVKIENFQLCEKNTIEVMREISSRYEVPIGIELSPDDDLVTNHYEIKVENGTLREVFDSLASQSKLYKWEIVENVINVFPVDSHRDLSLKEILATEISNLSISINTSPHTLRDLLTQNANVKQIMRKHNLSFENEVFTSRDISPLNRKFNLQFSNAVVRSVLNSVIRQSSSKYWVVGKYGKNGDLLLLNL